VGADRNNFVKIVCFTNGVFRVVRIIETAGGLTTDPLSPWFQTFERADEELRALKQQEQNLRSRLAIVCLDDVVKSKERREGRRRSDDKSD
jgi:hypothetical protein